MTIHRSMDDLERDARISRLERQILILSGQVAARDAAIPHLIKECFVTATDAAVSFVDQYPQMLAEIDTQVLSAITEADQQQQEVNTP